MNPLANPFAPGAGTPPPELVGRDTILEQAATLLGRTKAGRSERSLLLTGLRGVGKTVLLNEIERRANDAGYRTVFIEAAGDRTLGAQLAPFLRNLLFELNRLEGAGDKVKRGLAVLRSFIGTMKVTFGEMTFGLDISPERGTADSGDLEIDLTALFLAIAEAALDRNTAVALLIDEIQYFDQKELGALIIAMHKVQQRQLPFVLLGAGLPTLPALTGNAKSYAERLFSFPKIGALSEADSAEALQVPVQETGIAFTPSALREIFHQTQGYPYFLQEWGYQSWNMATESPITREVVQNATEAMVPHLDQNFFRVRYDRLTPSEKHFLRAMAELGAGPYQSGEIAEMLGVKVTSLGPRRASLIKKGMIYSPTYGELAFTVPLFDEFMKRAIPQFASQGG